MRACTANVNAASTSPPQGPIDVAPTSTPSISISFTKPSLLLIQPAGRLRYGLAHDADVAAGLPSLRFGHPDRPDLGIGEGHPWQGSVVRLTDGMPEDVGHTDPRLIDGDVGERALSR